MNEVKPLGCYSVSHPTVGLVLLLLSASSCNVALPDYESFLGSYGSYVVGRVEGVGVTHYIPRYYDLDLTTPNPPTTPPTEQTKCQLWSGEGGKFLGGNSAIGRML